MKIKNAINKSEISSKYTDTKLRLNVLWNMTYWRLFIIE